MVTTLDMPRPPLSELIPEFLEHLRTEERRAPNTLTRYAEYLAVFQKALGDCRIDALNSERLSIYKRGLSDRGLGPATIGGHISALRSFLRYLRTVKGWRTFDPEKIKRPRIPQREVSYLSKEEVRRLLDAIPSNRFSGIRDRALAEVLCTTGMRISEALALNRTSIDWERKDALIVGKGGKERRVYFSEPALARLSEYLGLRHDSHPAVFVTQGDDPQRMDAGDVWRKFRRYGRRAGIAKQIHPHILRHTMATTLLANGCPIGHIRTLLGHGHLQTTCRYYLGIISDAEARAAHQKFLSYRDEATDETHLSSAGR